MTAFLHMVLVSLSAIILENVIFTTALGTSTLIELSKKHWNILSFGGFITEFAVLSSLITYLFELLMQKSSVAMRFLPSIYIISLGTVYIVTLLVIRMISKTAFKKLKKYVHLSAFNCTVLCALFSNTVMNGSLGSRLFNAAAIGIGFAFAAYIITANYDRLNSDDIPAAFRGFPIYSLYIGVISMIIFAINR